MRCEAYRWWKLDWTKAARVQCVASRTRIVIAGAASFTRALQGRVTARYVGSVTRVADERTTRDDPQMRRSSPFLGPPPAGEAEESRFRAKHDPPTPAPFAKSRARVGDVQRQHVG